MVIEIPDIEGAQDVVQWFGYWPEFHDAEVLSIVLNRSGSSSVQIHTFEMTDQVDDKGYFVFTKHAIVTFVLEGFPKNSDGLVTTRIDHFSHQNVLSSVAIAKVAGGYTLTLDGCFGVDGTLCCEKLSVNLRPGIPKGSIYEPGED